MILYLSVYILSLFLLTKRSFFSSITLLLFTSPTARVFGNENLVFYNMPINNYLLYLVLPIFIIYKLFVNNRFKKEVITLFNSFRYFLIILFTFLLSSIYYNLFVLESNISYPFFITLSFFKGLICVIFLIYLTIENPIFNLFDEYKRLIIISFIYSIIVGIFQFDFMSLLGKYFVELYSTKSEYALNSALDLLLYFDFGRTTSIFSWTNQFSAFLAFAGTILFFISRYKLLDFLIILMTFSGFFLTSSRTGLILFFIFLFGSIVLKYKRYSFLILPISSVISFILFDAFAGAFNERILNFIFGLINLDVHDYIFESRAIFWLNRLDELLKNFEFILFGSWYKISQYDYIIENGFLYVFIIGGIFVVISYLIFISDYFYKSSILMKSDFLELVNFGKASLIVSVILLVSEISMSFYNSFRITEYLSINYGFLGIFVIYYKNNKLKSNIKRNFL